jgi:hypothetical protein
VLIVKKKRFFFDKNVCRFKKYDFFSKPFKGKSMKGFVSCKGEKEKEWEGGG